MYVMLKYVPLKLFYSKKCYVKIHATEVIFQ